MSGLMDLFRGEVRRHAAVLRERLLSLAESGAPASGDVELLHAGTSIRGAARVVGLAAVERLVEAMEAAAGAGAMTPERLAILLEAADHLAAMAQAAVVEAGPGLDALAARVEALAPAAREPVVTPLESRQSATTLELFRLECETHASAMGESLLQLEREPHRTELVDSLMRAAHSIKGAARVVGIDSVVKLAHAIEEVFTATRREGRDLGGDSIEVLLRATDAMADVGARGMVADEEALAALARQVRALGDAAPGAAAPARTTDAEPRTGPGVPSGPRPPAPSPVAGRTTGPHDGAPAADEADRVLRVRASHISRLVGLSGESLVESRRLKPLSQAQQRLRSRQAALADVVNDLHQALGAPPGDDAIGARIAELRSRVGECRSLLAEWQAEFDEHARRSEDLTMRTFREATRSRMRPLGDGLAAFPRMVRDVARQTGKQVDLTVSGDDIPIDRDILEKVEAPLNHLLRNAVDHGIEPPGDRAAAGKPDRGTIRLEARHRAGTIAVTIADDGRGIDVERIRSRVVALGLLPEREAALLEDPRLLDYIFAPGFSTRESVSEISGRGVGLDVVQSVLHEVGGSVHVSSERGQGTTFHLTLPVSRSVIRAVVVSVAGEPHAFPLARIDRLLLAPISELRVVEDRQYVMVEGASVALVPAAQILELPGAAVAGATLPVVVLSDRAHRIGFVVDRFMGEHDLVVRPLDPRLGRVSDLSAAAIMPDGAPVLIVDADDILRSVVRLGQVARIERIASASGKPTSPTKRVLVVDDSITVRELVRQLLEARGYEVEVAVDGLAAWSRVREGSYDLVVADVDMPRMDGISLTRSIKQDPRLRSVPVVLVTYRDSTADRARGLDAAADVYLTKTDFHDETLVTAVEELIGGPRR